MSQIVWVFGGSGAGKETFVRAIAGEKSLEIIHKLGWDEKEIIPCSESIEWVVQRNGDGNEKRRKGLPDAIIRLASRDNLVVLIKGQYLDLLHNRPQKVRSALPQCEHEIIFLNTSSAEAYGRLQKKVWWKGSYTQEDVRDWVEDQVKKLKKLQPDFEIITIDGGRSGNYEVSGFPPMLE